MTDTARFEAFVREYQDMVFATAIRLLGNAAEAEDVSQTVFLRAFQRFDAVSGGANPPGWLKTVTRNLCLNHLSRYRRRWQFFSEMDSGETDRPYVDTLAAPASDPVALERRDLQEQLERALRRLPDHQRVPLVLFHFEDMTYEAIAAALGVSLGKIKTDIHRGREALKKFLAVLYDAR